MLKKILIFSGYGLIFIVAVALFILHGIDGESIRPKLESGFKENTGDELKMKSLDLSLPFSATLVEMEYSTADKKTRVKLDALEIRPVFWRLLILSPTVRVTLRKDEGWVRVDVSPAFLFGKKTASLEANKFPLEKALVAVGGAELPLAAELSAEIDAAIPRNSAPDLQAKAKITLDNIKLKADSGWAKLFSGLAPKTAKCSVEIKDRKLNTKNCSTTTTVANADVRISSKLSDDMASSVLGGALVLEPRGKMAEALALLYMKYRKPDGAYYIPVSGTLSDPKFGL